MGNATAVVGSGYYVYLYDKSKAIINGNSSVSAFDRSAVKTISFEAMVSLYNRSRLVAEKVGTAILSNNSRAIIYSHRKNAIMHVYDNARVILRNSTKAMLHMDGRALCREKSKIEAWGENCRASMYDTSKAIVKTAWSNLKAELFDSASVQKTAR